MKMPDLLIESIEEFLELLGDHIEKLEEAVDNGEIDFEEGDEWLDACTDAFSQVENLKREV